MPDDDRRAFEPRLAIEYIMNGGILEVAPDQIITVSPEPLAPSAEDRAADAAENPPEDDRVTVFPSPQEPAEAEPEPPAPDEAQAAPVEMSAEETAPSFVRGSRASSVIEE